MPTKKNAQKKPASAKKTPAKKSVAKKTPAKKTPAKKASTPKKAVAKKAPAKKPTDKKKAGKTADKSATQEKPAAPSRPKASDFVKRPSHTPAIFKPASKRPIHILFTIEDVRELLKKRSKEEKLLQASEQARNGQNNHEAKGMVVVDEANPRTSKHHAATLDDILGISSPSAQKSASSKIPRKFQKYYKLLMELRDHVREELNLHSSDTLKRSQKEDAGDISISVDAGTDNFDRDFALSLLSSEQESLKEIEAAIQRIHDGTYGVCEVTGEPINDERLEAVPFTRFSLDGQRQYEMNARKRVTRTGAFLNEASGETISFGDDDGDN